MANSKLLMIAIAILLLCGGLLGCKRMNHEAANVNSAPADRPDYTVQLNPNRSPANVPGK